MKLHFTRIVRAVTVLTLIPLLASCAMFGGSRNTTEAELTQEAYDIPSEADYRRRLDARVAAEITENENVSRHEVIRKRPYYYKEYAEYPRGSADAQVTVIDQESRAVPYLADVTLDKVRYSTKLHRNRAEAAADSSFFRDTGKETLTFELRNNQWRRVSSFFVADTTEEMVNGEWVAVREQPRRTVLTDDPSGSWFSRTWDRVRFWR